MSKIPKLYAMCRKLKPNTSVEVYQMGFPSVWQKKLELIWQKNNPGKSVDNNNHYTTNLNAMLYPLLPDLLKANAIPVKKAQANWLVSKNPFTTKDRDKIFLITKIWIRDNFMKKGQEKSEQKKSEKDREIEQLAEKLLASMNPEDLDIDDSLSVKCLVDSSGAVLEDNYNDAYKILPALIASYLAGKTITIHGKPLKLYRIHSGPEQYVMTAPIESSKSEDTFSYVFSFKPQSMPLDPVGYLNIDLSIRSWIRKIWKDQVFLKQAISAHVRVREDQYMQIPISYNKGINWANGYYEAFRIGKGEALPAASEVLLSPGKYQDKILLPYKNGRNREGFSAPKVRSGVPNLDKEAIMKELDVLLEDFIVSEPIITTRFDPPDNFQDFKTRLRANASEYGSRAEYVPTALERQRLFRQWMKQCLEPEKIHPSGTLNIEIYSNWNVPEYDVVRDKLVAQLTDELGLGNPDLDSEFNIILSQYNAADFSDPLENDSCESRRLKIKDRLGKTEVMTICLFVLPDKDRFVEGKDPYRAIKKGFMDTQRLIQFITPEYGKVKDDLPEEEQDEEDKKKKPTVDHRVKSAIYDLYRACGLVTMRDPSADPGINKKKNILLKDTPSFRYLQMPCFGFYVATAVLPNGKGKKSNKKIKIPLIIRHDFLEGRTRVYCEEFSRSTVNLFQANFEIYRLVDESVDRLFNISGEPVAQLIADLLDQDDLKETGAILLAETSWSTKECWAGLNNKSLSKYEYVEDYIPKSLPLEKKGSGREIRKSLIGSGLRVFRVRVNDEVPDYYLLQDTDGVETHGSSRGVFPYNKVFWGMSPKPHQGPYDKSLTQSKLTHSNNEYKERQIVELFPVQLQKGDSAEEFACYVDLLRRISVQFRDKDHTLATNLPLVLHLGQKLEENILV